MAKASKKSVPGNSNFADIERYLLRNYEFRHNPILERTEFRQGGKKGNNFQLLSERDVNTLFRELNKSNIKCTISTLRSLLNSNFIEPHNPFEEYFKTVSKLSIGKVDYIDQLIKTVKAENDTFWKWAFKKWLVNLVACALEGTETSKKLGIKNGINQQVLVFVGEQGIGKTTWLNNLLPKQLEGYLYSGIVNPSNKDTLVNLSENLIINLDELENLNKTELGSLKSLITQTAIRLRRAYGIYNENYVRRASFVGSVNEAEFLTDTTGNRRYLVVEAKHIDYTHKVLLDKVYCQAYKLLEKGFSFEFKGHEIDEIDSNNNKYLRQSVEEELLLKHYRIPEREDDDNIIITLTPTEIINNLQEETKIKLGDQSSIRRLGNALHKHKFQKISKGNSKPYQLVRITTPKNAQENHQQQVPSEIVNDQINIAELNLDGEVNEIFYGKNEISLLRFNCALNHNNKYDVSIIEISLGSKNEMAWYEVSFFEKLLTSEEESSIELAKGLLTDIEKAKIEIEKEINNSFAN